jgi:hypothetical protein
MFLYSSRASDGVGAVVFGIPCDVLVSKEAEHLQTHTQISAKGEEKPKSQR